jgi:tetratricopeptide (TPR) repeat protein
MKTPDREPKGNYSLVFPEGMGEASQANREDKGWLFHVFLAHLLILFIGYPGYLTYRWVRPKIDYWRAEKLAATAEVWMNRGDYNAAASELERASELSRDCLALLRAQALFHSHFKNPQGLICWRRWDDTGKASRADKLAFTRLALDCLRTDIARRVLKPLHVADPTDAEILSLVAEIFFLSGDTDQAVSAMQDALTRDPANQAYEFRLGQFELRGKTEAVRNSGKRRLFALISHIKEDRSPIARQLLLEGKLSPAEDRLLISLLDKSNHSTNSVGEQLIRLAVELRKNPLSIGPILNEFMPSPRTHEVIVEAAQLLGELGMYPAVLELVPKVGADRDRSLALLRLGALAGTGQWEEMERLLSTPDLPLSIPLRALFKAGVAQSAGLQKEAPRLWQLAMGAGSGNSRFLELLAVRAEAWGSPETAIAAWEQLLRDPLKTSQAARELLRLGAIWNDLPATIVALKRVIQLYPQEPRFRIQLALSQLMEEQEIDQARATLKELEPRSQNEPTFYIASALAALRFGSPEAAVDWVSRTNIVWSNAPPVWRVVQVAALGRGFQRTRARELARELDVTRLSPSEVELILPWLPTTSIAR